MTGGERDEGVQAPARTGAERGGRRFGLQTRTIFAFAVGAALLSAALAFGTFVVVRQDLLAQRVSSALREAYGNAHLVKVELRSPSADVGKALDSVASTTEAHSLINRHGLWYSSAASARGTAVPQDIARVVLAGHVAEQRVSLDGVPTIVVGIPLPSVGVSYFEERPLMELRSTLRLLGTVLVVAALATTVVGALAGWWASRRLIRPLSDVALIASEIAGGTLDRRVPADPDLQPLVSSFNDMVAALQDRIERDARFTSDVTHELRSPLTTIGASVELLGSYRDRLPGGGMQALDTLQFEVDRFSAMVQDLLEMARWEAGAVDVHFTDVPLDELVRLTVVGHDPAVPVEVSPAASGLLVRGDKRRLQRVLANLLQNADVHGGGATRVAVDTDGGWAHIAVEDQGPGVAPGERDRVFERFYRGPASGRRRDTSGTGLGLALVAEHVEAHRGWVRIDGRAGGGARVVVTLPAVPR
ncbi:MAG: sensor histidine kinase [Acidimicrobiales bacterium]